MSEPKQVIVVRRDLGMSPGKLAAQVAHASIGALFDNSIRWDNDNGTHGWQCVELTAEIDEWFHGSQVKIVVGVDSEKELLEIYEKAQNLSLPRHIVKDEGRTELGKPTYTCVGVGPADPEKINEITGKLKLL